jgi:hypothetical protein
MSRWQIAYHVMLHWNPSLFPIRYSIFMSHKYQDLNFRYTLVPRCPCNGMMGSGTMKNPDPRWKCSLDANYVPLTSALCRISADFSMSASFCSICHYRIMPIFRAQVGTWCWCGVGVSSCTSGHTRAHTEMSSFMLQVVWVRLTFSTALNSV